MHGTAFTYYLRAHGKIIAEIECELEASVEGGRVTVDGVYADVLETGGDFINIGNTGDPMLNDLAERIALAAENNDTFCAAVFEAEGLVYSGGANNPTGHFKRFG